MSWAAHELEAYVLQKHLRTPVSFLAILVGSLGPDMLTKLPVYGLSIGSFSLKASDPALYHRGWPGVGPTHSLLFGVLVAGAVLALTRNRAWSAGLLVGLWAHVLTDTFDSVGTMLFFPFTTQHYSVGLWAYAAGEGRYGDAAAYYSSPGLLWDLFWLAMVLRSLPVLGRREFTEVVVPRDPRPWGWLTRHLGGREVVALAVYRAYFVYGACRIVGWFAWARFLNPRRGDQVVDFTWGGPHWVEPVSFPAASVAQFLSSTAWGLALTAATVALAWATVGRTLWRRAGPPVVAAV
jgi:membrane-bound metal-dependent hydrolase YbcI (DUF457 family)